MRDNPNGNRSRFYFLEVVVIAAVALLFTVSFIPHQGPAASTQPMDASHDTAPAAVEPALQILDGVTHHG